MILQRLAEHYDRIVAEGNELPTASSSRQLVSFALILNLDGTLHSIADERDTSGKKPQARGIILPGQARPTGVGDKARFLWGNTEDLLGWTQTPANENVDEKSKREARAREYFRAFRDKQLAYEVQLGSVAFTTVCDFLRAWSPEMATPYSKQLAELSTNFGYFRIVGQLRGVHEEIDQKHQDDDETGVEPLPAYCLISGKHGPTARLHEPAIKGVRDANPMGAKLVSFDKGSTAFSSYGKVQGGNAPVSVDFAIRYAVALNHLLDSRQGRRIQLGDATVVYWADHPTALEDVVGGVFGGFPDEDALPREDKARAEQARDLLKQLQSGTQNVTDKPDEEPTKFFILGLSPNASRISVRLWVEQDASELRSKLAQHVQDLALAGGREGRMLAAWQVVQAMGRAELDRATGRLKGFDAKAVSPQLAGELARAIILGTPYPQALLATMIRRIRSDGEVAWARVSAIKAVLVRNSHLTKQAASKDFTTPSQDRLQEITMELNSENSSTAYRCGRIFAVLERAQELSVTQDNPASKLNATIKDRFFGAAAATPLLVLPRLLVLNNHHTRKLREGSKRYMSGLLGSIMDCDGFAFPRQLTLEQQGEFIVGYFQQRQDFYKSKPKELSDTEPEEAETAA